MGAELKAAEPNNQRHWAKWRASGAVGTFDLSSALQTPQVAVLDSPSSTPSIAERRAALNTLINNLGLSRHFRLLGSRDFKPKGTNLADETPTAESESILEQARAVFDSSKEAASNQEGTLWTQQ